MTEVITCREYNRRGFEQHKKDCNEWKPNQGGFPNIGFYIFEKPNGEQVLDEVSNKKSLKVNLLNSGIGDFEDWDPDLPDNLKQGVYREKARKRNIDFVNSKLDKVKKLISKYDKNYSKTGNFKNYFRVVEDLKWSQDLEIGQYITIKENGIIYPICFNSTTHIFKRGTHRSLFLAHTKSDVPIFIQYPKLNDSEMVEDWDIKLEGNLIFPKK